MKKIYLKLVATAVVVSITLTSTGFLQGPRNRYQASAAPIGDLKLKAMIDNEDNEIKDSLGEVNLMDDKHQNRLSLLSTTQTITPTLNIPQEPTMPDDSHRYLAEFAAEGYPGLNQEQIKWIGDGAYDEDHQIPSKNCFHAWDPDTDDGFAPFDIYFVCGSGLSRADSLFYDAINEDDEEKSWKLLGQVIHLLGDAATPAHANLDPHIPFVDPDPYESWLKEPSSEDPNFDNTQIWREQHTPIFMAYTALPTYSELSSGQANNEDLQNQLNAASHFFGRNSGQELWEHGPTNYDSELFKMMYLMAEQADNWCSEWGKYDGEIYKDCEDLSDQEARNRRDQLFPNLTSYTIALIDYYIHRTGIVTDNRSFAVTTQGFDNIGAILTNLGYSWTQISDTDLNTYNNIKQFDVIFANCSSIAYNNGPLAANSLRQFVENGGSLYASDWAYTYVSNAFPGFINFFGNPRIGSIGTVSADIMDSGLASYIDPNNPPSSITLNYNLPSWVVIENISSPTTVHLQGDVQTSIGNLSNSALTVSFEPYPNSTGKVFYTTFHNEAQLSDVQRKLLEYFVLVPTTSQLTSEAEQIIQTNNSFVKQTNINTIDPDEVTSLFPYYLSESSNLIFAINWPGSILRLSIFAPDGSLYHEVESFSPPAYINIQDAQAGLWHYQVTGVDVPHENYPYVVVLGDGIVRLSYLPLILKNYSPPIVGFDSQFNGSSLGWVPHAGSWTTSSNYYGTTGLSEAFASTSYDQTYSNLDYRVKFMRDGCEECTNSIIIRGTATPFGDGNRWQNGYSFNVTRNGFYSIVKYAKGTGSMLQTWAYSPAIHTGGSWNTVRAVAIGSNLYFYINGTLVWSGSDASYASGLVGIAMYRTAESTGDQLWADWATLDILSATAAQDFDPGTISVDQERWNYEANYIHPTGEDQKSP